jgi:hypothetical protein
MAKVVEPTIDVGDRPVMDWDEPPTKRRRERMRRAASARLDIDRGVEGPDAVIRTLELVRRYCADTRFERERSATTWRWWSRGLLLPATALAGVAGVLALATTGFEVLIALAALVAATMGAIVTSLTPDRKAEARRLEALRLGAIERNIAVLLYVDREGLARDRMRQVLETVLGQLDEMNGLPPTPSFLYGLPQETAPATSPTRRNGFRSLDEPELPHAHTTHDVRV